VKSEIHSALEEEGRCVLQHIKRNGYHFYSYFIRIYFKYI